MWMEETVGTRVNEARSRELIATGATRIATACPFCYIMIDDGVKAQGKEDDEVRVADIAMHLLDAIERGERASSSSELAPEAAAASAATPTGSSPSTDSA
jgi:hypothetical protein